MTCPDCREVKRENETLRALVDELWNDWRRISHELRDGRFDRDPVPPLRMLGRDPEDFEEAA